MSQFGPFLPRRPSAFVSAMRGKAAATAFDGRADYDLEAHILPTRIKTSLVQARATEALQIMLAGGVLPDLHLVCDPGEQDIGLRATIIPAILSGRE